MNAEGQGENPRDRPTWFIFVHGTWGWSAFRRGSAIWQLVKHEFPDAKTQRFIWNGRNSHRGRCKAAVELAERIRRVPGWRSCKIVFICHSHGGNVALQATRLLGQRCDFVFLGTPFMLAKPRCTAIVLLALRWTLLWMMLFVFLVCFLAQVSFQAGGPIGLATAGVLLIAWNKSLSERKYWSGMYSKSRAWLDHLKERHGEFYAIDDKLAEVMIVYRTTLDEALFGLRLNQLAYALPMLLSVVLAITVTLTAAYTGAVFAGGGLSVIEWKAQTIFTQACFWSSTVAILCLVGLIGEALVILGIALFRVPLFGLDNPMGAWLHLVTPTPTLKGARVLHLPLDTDCFRFVTLIKSWARRTPRHSLYDNPQVLETLAVVYRKMDNAYRTDYENWLKRQRPPS